MERPSIHTVVNTRLYNGLAGILAADTTDRLGGNERVVGIISNVNVV